MNNQNDNSSFLVGALVVVTMAIMAVVYTIARSIGADFVLTLRAIGFSFLFLMIAAGVWWFTNESHWPSVHLIFVVLLVCIWPLWWAVLDSIANGGLPMRDYDTSEGGLRSIHSAVFYAQWYFKWSVEILLLAWAAFALKTSR